jgi:hypothetical protein
MNLYSSEETVVQEVLAIVVVNERICQLIQTAPLLKQN